MINKGFIYKGVLAGCMALSLVGVAGAQVDAQRVVATVNGVEIKGGEYYRRMEWLPSVGKNMGNGFVEMPPGFLTLDQLITEKLVFQLAKNKGVMPTEAEVQADLNSRRQANPKLIEDWAATGRTEAELLYTIRYELAQFKILTAGVTVTDQEISDTYKKNPAMFTTPKMYKLRVIVVKQEDTAAVDQDLASGKKFADVARARSVDASAVQGGEYGTVPVDYLNPQVKTALTNVKIGQTTGWFQSGDGMPKFKFLVEDIIAEKLQPMSPELREATRKRMMMDKGKVRNDLKKELNALRNSAAIDIKDKSFSEAYKKWIGAASGKNG